MKTSLNSQENAGKLLRILGWLALAAAICFALAAFALVFSAKRGAVPGLIRNMLVAAVFCVAYLRVGSAVKEKKRGDA